VLLLGVAWLLRSELRPAGDEVLALVACGWAVLCPLAAVGLRGEGLIAPAEPAQPGASAARRIVFFAVLESGIALCAVAPMLTRWSGRCWRPRCRWR
jgi:hypothetical protein